METKSNNNIAEMTFETAQKELEAIVRKLEAGQSDLETSIADYARGISLKEYCLQKLVNAKMKVEKIMQMPDGQLAVQPFEEN
jgi:exodeoxyribonuclease VII small subunit